ncbi:MAG: peptidylprolyl isomerase [Gemmatimonadetes bacterium]|nr:peptidylprolyl isomerase [Gemmatimonadota bacterium]
MPTPSVPSSPPRRAPPIRSCAGGPRRTGRRSPTGGEGAGRSRPGGPSRTIAGSRGSTSSLLRLADRGYFDGIRWHRVVPNFVVQAGDPRGDGNGGPGWSIRDEINRRRYNAWTVGMALSGPDTGGSQWFITLAPEPHLDGNYTVFGRLRAGNTNALKVVQGDQIRRIHR